jgi:competence protein ComEA
MRGVSFVTVMMFAMLAVVQASAIAQSPQEGKPKPKAAAAATPATLLNLNTATVADLQALPGIGVATAKLILEHRQKNGGFKKVEELMNIKGIGEKSFLKLKPLVTVAPEKAERQDVPGKGL